ncbi:MAG: CDC27 family protein [Treponema sp.]|jgi:tetratricopeptide (TPR) repeat protein|nr:CDC27 family protein [Treponema sp.]
MRGYRVVVVLGVILVFTIPGHTQNTPGKGDGAIAEKYLAWAQRAMNQGRWAEALVGLERGRDFSDASSDMAYLLALVRFHEGKPLAEVLEAVQQALETRCWHAYTPDAARLLEAETLIQLRRYADALNILARVSPSVEGIYLKLRALQGLGNREAFSRLMVEALNTYPRDPRPSRLFLSLAQYWQPAEAEEYLVSLVLKRLPLLLEADEDLAYLAAPFMRDIGEARRLVGAYRGVHRGVAGSIAPALNLGLIDGRTAVDELFSPSTEKETNKLDKALLSAIWKLLRNYEEQDRFRNNLVQFSGFITEDADKDGYSESKVQYEEGMLCLYTYDGDQDGLPELTVFFESGVPVRAEVAGMPEFSYQTGPFAAPLTAQEQRMVTIQWEQYPAVGTAQMEGVQYQLKPFEFFFLPIYFKRLESGGLWYPEREPFTRGISRRMLIADTLFIERPSREFAGALERVEFDQGIPQRAWEFLDGRIISTTEFYQGRPQMQRIDLDVNGHLETIRRFRPSGDVPPNNASPLDQLFFGSRIEVSESDWDEDGLFEYEEQYVYAHEGEEPDPTIEKVLRFWDIDRDGIREFSDQISYRNQN